MTTEEGNKLIAEFDGVYKWYSPIDKTVFTDLTWLDYISINYELKYHSSWDWLMPCVRKAKATPHSAEYTGWGILNSSLLRCEIDGVFEELVEFIQWHNTKKSEKKQLAKV